MNFAERRRALMGLSQKKPTFTIQGQEYEFEKGMKWYQWISSPYNDGRVSRAGPLVLFDNKYHIESGSSLAGAGNVLVEDSRYVANKYWIFKSYYGLTGMIVYSNDDEYIPSDKAHISSFGILNLVFGTESGGAFNFANYRFINLSYKAEDTSTRYKFSYGISTKQTVYPNIFVKEVQPNVANQWMPYSAYLNYAGTYYMWICKSNSSSYTQYKDIYLS